MEWYQHIENCSGYRKDRVRESNYFIRNEGYLPELMKICCSLEDENHSKALWLLEMICEKKLKLFAIYIDQFCEVLPKLKVDSAVRPATKICMFLAKSNHRKNGIDLTQEQEHNLIEALIDRLIQDEKVAAKVYAMKALFVLGKKYNWIYEELKPIISQDAANHSSAYQASARNILKKINKQK
jgi:hypothetical protein